MPLFGSSVLEQEIDKVTQETVDKEDVPAMYEICDRVNATPDVVKEAYRCLVKRLQSSNPRVALLALSVLDVCVMNCGKKFHLEICSRDFTSLVKAILNKGHPKVQHKLKFLLVKWANNEFKSDPQLAIIDNFIQRSRMEGVSFEGTAEPPTIDTMDVKVGRERSTHQQQQEEDDLAKAIELSLQESKKKDEGGSAAGSGVSSSLYPSMSKVAAMTSTSTSAVIGSSGDNGSNPASSKVTAKESRKVRALYDFEAAEENELSFKAGEIIIVLEDRDPNWWKGSNHRGDGLFPSNFVTSDLEAPTEEPAAAAASTTTATAAAEAPTPAPVTQVDEAKIDMLLHMLHDADPTVLERTEVDAKMESLQAECALMTPLIDAELEKIDRKHQTLTSLGQRLTDALASYHQLLRQPQLSSVPPMVGMHPPQMGPVHQQMPYYAQMPMQMPPQAGYVGVPMPAVPGLAGQAMPPPMHMALPPGAVGAPGRPVVPVGQLGQPGGGQPMPPNMVMPHPAYVYATHPAMNGALPPDAGQQLPVVSQAQPSQ